MSESANGQQNQSGAAVFRRVKSWFDRDEWQFEEHEFALVTAFGGKSGEWPVVAEVRGSGVVIIMSLLPFEIPTARLEAVMEAVTRANYGLGVGSFDLDLESGALQFRTALDVEGDEASLGDVVLRHLVYQNVVAMDRYLPAFKEVSEGADPGVAIERVEG